MVTDDTELWKSATRDVKPIKREGPIVETPQKTKKKQPSGARETVILKPQTAPKPTQRTAKDIDGKTAEKLRKGQMPIEATLDLHNMTQGPAHTALINFVKTSLKAERRCILVITGKGKDGQGILRKKIPDWLEDPELAPYILQLTQAHQKHGGSGAFYIYLRRQR